MLRRGRPDLAIERRLSSAPLARRAPKRLPRGAGVWAAWAQAPPGRRRPVGRRPRLPTTLAAPLGDACEPAHRTTPGGAPP
jgi:hypothetical protein